MIKKYFSSFCPVSAPCWCHLHEQLADLCILLLEVTQSSVFFRQLGCLYRLPFPPNFKLSHEPLYIFLEITHTEKMLLLMSQISRKCAVIIREALSRLLSQPHLKCVTRTHLLFRNVPSHVPPNWCLSSGGISLLLYQMSLLYSTCKEFY